jgi:hypothetical protein
MSDPATKPHKGQIKNWFKSETEGFGLGYRIRGEFVDHPEFGNARSGVTSYVVAHDEATGEIETRNSRYTLVGPAVQS